MFDVTLFPHDRVVTIYSEDLEAPVHGYLLAGNQAEWILACINQYGEADGFGLLHAASVFRVDYDSSLEQKLHQLYRLKHQHHPTLELPADSSSLRQALLQWAYHTQKIVTIAFPDAHYDLFGWLTSLEPYQLKVIDQCDCEPDAPQGYAMVDPSMADVIWVDEIRARDAVLVLESRQT